MYKARIEKLHKNGVITDEEYDNLVDIGFDDNGKLKPGVYKGDITTRYCLGFEPGKENLIEAVKNSEPWLGAESDYPELFGTYGMGVYGICDYWRWWTLDNLTEVAIKHGKKPLESATELELWKMLALSNLYWYTNYSEWHDEAEKRAHDWEMCYHKANGDFDGFNLDKEVLDKIKEAS